MLFPVVGVKVEDRRAPTWPPAKSPGIHPAAAAAVLAFVAGLKAGDKPAAGVGRVDDRVYAQHYPAIFCFVRANTLLCVLQPRAADDPFSLSSIL